VIIQVCPITHTRVVDHWSRTPDVALDFGVVRDVADHCFKSCPDASNHLGPIYGTRVSAARSHDAALVALAPPAETRGHSPQCVG
jgi:hypothetical protein